jgi:hypothetical protein
LSSHGRQVFRKVAGGLMSALLWREVTQEVLPLVPEALVLVAALAVTIAYRRRLGGGATTAITGFAFLALAGVGHAAWRFWYITREATPTLTPDDDIEYPMGRELTYALEESVDATLVVFYLAGLVWISSSPTAACSGCSEPAPPLASRSCSLPSSPGGGRATPSTEVTLCPMWKCRRVVLP